MFRVVLKCGHWFFGDLTDWECERLEALCPLCGLRGEVVEVGEVNAEAKTDVVCPVCAKILASLQLKPHLKSHFLPKALKIVEEVVKGNCVNKRDMEGVCEACRDPIRERFEVAVNGVVFSLCEGCFETYAKTIIDAAKELKKEGVMMKSTPLTGDVLGRF